MSKSANAVYLDVIAGTCLRFVLTRIVGNKERGVKENWQVVPIKPTDAMICAALDDHDKNYRQSYSDIYRAMLAAAPKPESYRLQIPSEFETK